VSKIPDDLRRGRSRVTDRLAARAPGHAIVSGNDSRGDNEYGAFNTLYATNHPFYGLMDLFLNIPQQTGELGLVEALGRAALEVRSWTVQADAHHFRLQHGNDDGQKVVGFELDLTAARTISTGFAAQAGYSMLLPGRAGRVPPVGLGADALHWAYVQATVRF
jgi:hypothetical protein